LHTSRTVVANSVNSAIRYVSDMRYKIIDPIIKKDADETLAKLLTLD
jgi:hypothetical protein